METFELGTIGDRVLMVKKTDDDESVNIILMVKGYDIKQVELSPSRWATLCDHIDEINASARVVQSGSSDIKLCLHIGFGYYVSVTSGFKCVDIRKFYKPYKATQSEIKATKRGVALRFHEWSDFCTLAQTLRDNYPSLSAAQPCSLLHDNQAAFYTCRECHPFVTTS